MHKSQPPEASILTNRIEPRWFARNEEIRLTNLDGAPQPHLFFDAFAGLSKGLNYINFVPLSLAGKREQYTIHLTSGQRVFSHFNCTQPDVWGQRGTVSGTTEFSTGFVPRSFDQLNEPQRIIVFGGEGRFRLDEPLYYRVRLVGGYVEQSCPLGACAGVKEWRGRLVLIGVDEEDARWAQVKVLADLLKRVNWDEVRAQLETLPGHNVLGDKKHPALKVGKPIDGPTALEFMLKRSTMLSRNEVAKTHGVCQQLYERFWEFAGKETLLDRPVKSPEEAREHAKTLAEMRKAGKPPYFNMRFGEFVARMGGNLATCQRLVYPGNPNHTLEKTNFLLWSLMFIKLHREGWHYSCRDKAWQVTNDGKRALRELRENLRTCSVREIDNAMNFLPPFLRTLRGLSGERWRFVGWDEHAHGSHAKVHAWVAVPERSFSCEKDENAKVRESWKELPPESPWKPRYSPNSFKDSEYIF